MRIQIDVTCDCCTHHHHQGRRTPVTAKSAWTKTSPIIEGTFKMADLTFKDSDSPETATLDLTDAKGFSTTADNTPTWEADDGGTVITLAPSADGVSCTATPVAPGVSHVTATTVDENGDIVTGTSTVTVTPGEAEALDVAWAPMTPPAPAPAPVTDPPAAASGLVATGVAEATVDPAVPSTAQDINPVSVTSDEAGETDTASPPHVG